MPSAEPVLRMRSRKVGLGRFNPTMSRHQEVHKKEFATKTLMPATSMLCFTRETHLSVDFVSQEHGVLMTHKYRGCIVVLSINKSVEPNEEQKVLTSSFD
jgi:hypothetical protein